MDCFLFLNIISVIFFVVDDYHCDRKQFHPYLQRQKKEKRSILNLLYKSF